MRVININGPINSGKSTVSRLLVKALPQALFVEVDELWDDEEQERLGLTREQGGAERTRRLEVLVEEEKAKGDFEYLVFAYPMTDNLFQEWKKFEDEKTSFVAITLAPRLEVCLQNHGTRALDEWEVNRIREMYVQGYHNSKFADLIIDNGEQTPQETVDIVLEYLRYDWGVYGDSIAVGYGNDSKSWFDGLAIGKKSLKLAASGEKIADVLRKIKNDSNSYQTLILAVGINDLLSPDREQKSADFADLLACYEEILKVATSKAKRVLVQSVLSVREELFPNQDWLEQAMWVKNSRIIAFNQALSELCLTWQVDFVDCSSSFDVSSLAELYCDAVHLNSQGQGLLERVYRQFFEGLFSL